MKELRYPEIPEVTEKVRPPSPASAKGITLSWHNLSVSVRKKNEEKSSWFSTRYDDTKILRKVSGVVEPGTFMAIMGPGGSGKTTLLAAISQRLKGDVKGRILVNGKEISKELMLKLSGFMPQQDLNISTLTVMEHLQLMARFKMDRNTNAIQRTQRVLALISELGIVKCTNTRISALSGGERKRLALAVQMLTDPALLFCDEPTTGLDSYSANSVIEQLRQLAGRGKAVICTIHQPASGLFDMFHSVYLLVGGGKLALTCSPSESSTFFSSIGLVCPPTYNIAEFLVSKLTKEEDAESFIRVNKICSEFKMSKHYENLLRKLDSITTNGKQPYITETSKSPYDSICEPKNDFDKYLSIQPPKKITQLYWLLWRSLLDIGRNPQDQLLRLAFYLMLALVISTPYVGLSIDQEGIQNLQGFLYLVIVESCFAFTYSVMHTFPSEIPILSREVGNGLYTPGPYYISKMIILLPRAVIEPIVFSAIAFWIPGLWGGISGFVKFCLPVIVCSVTATAYGCAIATVFENVATASLVSVPLDQISLAFCGIFMSLSDVPFHFAWVKYISIFYYGIEAVSILQWTQVENIPCSVKHEVPCISTGEGVLQYYGYSKNHLFIDIMGLLLIYLFCHIIGFIAFCKRSKRQAVY